MTEKEIKKLSEAYAEYTCPMCDYLDDNDHEIDLMINHDDAKSVLEWLSKDYCIVPKKKATELYECGFTGLTTPQTRPILRYLFGKELFQKKGE